MSEPAVTFPKIVPAVKVLCIGRPSRRRIHDNKVPTGARIRIHDRGIDHLRDSDARDLVLGGTIHDYADKMPPPVSVVATLMTEFSFA